jgi:hypothetical protein
MRMRTDPRADEVRNIVEKILARFLREKADCQQVSSASVNRLGCRFPRLFQPNDDELPRALEINETILIDRGQYVARSYRAAGYLAMWLVSLGLLQFYDEDGRMLATVNLFESLRPQGIAA